MFTKHDKDIQFLENHLKSNPNSILFARLADVYLQMENVDEAIQLCEEGIKKHPYYATGHFVLGKCYMANKLYEQAEKEFKRVLLFDPKFLAAHKYYGDLMREIGWQNTCEMSYRKILQIDPLDEVALNTVKEFSQEKKEEKKGDAFGLSMSESKTEEDATSVEPLPVSPEEEDLLFESVQQPDEPRKEAKQEPPEIEESQTDVDERKAEEFSYILDDIFKDEIVEEEVQKQATPKAEKRAAHENSPESYLATWGMSQKEENKKGAAKKEDRKQDINGSAGRRPSAASERESQKTPQQSIKGKKSGERIVTPTLGEIYAAQGQYNKAIEVFETLLKKHPDNEFYLDKLDDLKQKLEDAKDETKG